MRAKLDYVVTFNATETLTNVFSGKEEDYYFETRDNILYRNFIVKYAEQNFHGIEYEIYAMGFIDNTEKLTLLHFLRGKIALALHEHQDINPETTWLCPDTDEKYSFGQIRKMLKDEHDKFIKALNM